MGGLTLAGALPMLPESPRKGKDLQQQLEDAWTGKHRDAKRPPLHSKAIPAPWQRQLLDRPTYPDDVNTKYMMGRVSFANIYDCFRLSLCTDYLVPMTRSAFSG